MQSNAYAFKFMIAVCVGCALLVSTAATLLKPLQTRNRQVDMQRNILEVVGLLDPDESPSDAEIRQRFEKEIRLLVVDAQGNPVDSSTSAGRPVLTPEDLDEQRKNQAIAPDQRKLPLYVREENGQPRVYGVPIYGRGLWSTLYGYLALDADGTTVRGITFYKHGETPGLGGEVDNPRWKEQFLGKKIADADGTIVSVQVLKPGQAPRVGPDHAVDAISGATITSNGVQSLLQEALETYRPYFERIGKWKPQGP